jgi:nitrate reductase beta subunit
MRAYMRDINLGREPRAEIPASVDMGEEPMYEMYRLLAIAKYEDRYVIPTAYATDGHRLEETVTECSLDFEGGPGMYTTGSGPFGESSGQPVPMAVESFQALKERQTSEDIGVGAGRSSRVNLLNWDGKGSPDTMFAPRPGSPRLPTAGDER